MATLRPFRALRPNIADAGRIAAVPYDVVSADEARALANGSPLSFLHVSRAEIDLPPGTDPYSDAVYQRASENFAALRRSSLELEDEPSLYVYRLRAGRHEQVGLAGCYSLEEYDRDAIRKHERTRRDKEDDRTRHMLALGAQTGPVFLTYRATDAIDGIVSGIVGAAPLFDFVAEDGVSHTIWRVHGVERDALVAAMGGVPALYIADGHHRAASAARARGQMRASTFLAVAFPHDQVQILPYNRVVRDLAGLSSDGFLRAVRERFEVAAGSPTSGSAPGRGEIAMYLADGWHTLRPRAGVDTADPIGSLDVSVLQDQLLAPVLKIADVRTDKRIDFVGGARGTRALEQLVSSGLAAVAFSLHPVSVAALMAVSDAGAIMPPKSTWFEPKLRDGLLIHVL